MKPKPLVPKPILRMFRNGDFPSALKRLMGNLIAE
jgi:hypothetical protein